MYDARKATIREQRLLDTHWINSALAFGLSRRKRSCVGLDAIRTSTHDPNVFQCPLCDAKSRHRPVLLVITGSDSHTVCSVFLSEINSTRASCPFPKRAWAMRDRPSATFNAKTITIRVARKSRTTVVLWGARANGSTLTTVPCLRATTGIWCR
jgi:hypothetical protein